MPLTASFLASAAMTSSASTVFVSSLELILVSVGVGIFVLVSFTLERKNQNKTRVECVKQREERKKFSFFSKRAIRVLVTRAVWWCRAH